MLPLRLGDEKEQPREELGSGRRGKFLELSAKSYP